MIDREAIVEVLERYNPSGIQVATIGSHSALDVCDGAVEEGFRTFVVCERGREAPYTRYFRASRDKDGRPVRKPRRAASRAIPVPTIPPPITRTSRTPSCIFARWAARVRAENSSVNGIRPSASTDS